MDRLLGASQPTILCGRRNLLLDGYRRLLADVVEILARPDRPARSRPPGANPKPPMNTHPPQTHSTSS